jgi:hypothetical protein
MGLQAGQQAGLTPRRNIDCEAPPGHAMKIAMTQDIPLA